MQTNKRYWLKFSIPAAIIGAILSIWFDGVIFSRSACIGLYLNPDGTQGTVCPPPPTFFEAAFNLQNLCFTFVVAVILFLIFAFIGWLYGKIKSKMSKTN
ncbi:MAG TPA: hypothetical protein VL335_01420 [Candidatus Paceibacterota bacterium]|jgi:hypothetical protein|nr:hypothetical protein [Candidatus Paceibacterota bacterium]